MKFDRRREKILTAARELFATFGLKKTTMEDIARKSGMGKSTLYYYFKNKDDIFTLVLHRETEELKKRLLKAIAEGTTPQTKLLNYVLMRMKYLKELQNYYSIIADEYLDMYPFIERKREEFTRWEIERIKEFFQQGVREGIYQIENVEETAVVFTVAMKGMEYPFLREKWGESEQEMENRITRMLNLLFKGIEKR